MKALKTTLILAILLLCSMECTAQKEQKRIRYYQICYRWQNGETFHTQSSEGEIYIYTIDGKELDLIKVKSMVISHDGLEISPYDDALKVRTRELSKDEFDILSK